MAIETKILYTVTLSEDEFELVILRLSKPTKLKSLNDRSFALFTKLLMEREKGLTKLLHKDLETADGLITSAPEI